MDQEIYHHIRKESVVNFVINTVINGIIAWFILRSKGVLMIWGGEHNFGEDIAITAFLLLLIISLIVISINKMNVRKGKVPSLDWNQGLFLHRVLSKIPQNTFLSSLVFGLFGLVVVVPLTLFPLYALGITQMSPFAYSIFKGVWAGVLAGVMIWPIILYALGNSDQQPATSNQ
ncbi:MAG: hypothetical protein JRJ20_13740 [Deltaproteobacteria bacterium]|nr:hypothetical protein [Deltaproteobacteria bacterium]